MKLVAIRNVNHAFEIEHSIYCKTFAEYMKKNQEDKHNEIKSNYVVTGDARPNVRRCGCLKWNSLWILSKHICLLITFFKYF